MEVSIHATLAGGDRRLDDYPIIYKVSIHATLAGGDAGLRYWKGAGMTFLSTPPSRVATQRRS